eukprot:TRINITY_DN39941_c0_g1_i1.p1 TRINITY_DN39941_c0_g1~~TRINITY_DN39941_c0_g1_i1.p1  ORF type:complete len:796 (-),score=143.77 TRINITY_DN39941_c0_g1_i1:35-2422(-)
MWRCQLSLSGPARAWQVASRGYVNAKITRRRIEFEQKTYPRASTREPERLPRRGRRGGWMKDPQRGVAKLDGSNSAQRAWWEDHAGAVDRKFVSKLQQSQGDEAKAASGGSFQELLDQHLSEIDALKVQMPSADEFRLPHIRRLAKTPKPNPVHEATVASPPVQAPEEPEEEPVFLRESLDRRQQRRRGRFLGARPKGEERAAWTERTPATPALSSRKSAWLDPDSSDSEGSDLSDSEVEASRGRRGRRSSRLSKAQAHSIYEQPGSPRTPSSSSSAHALSPEEAAAAVAQPAEPMEPLRYSDLGDLWSALGASWVEHNRCVVPSTFPAPEEVLESAGATLDSYHHTRQSASLMDVSFKVGLRVTGADREFVADQFLTCNLRAMRAGDVQYACVLDSKGLMLDDAFVYLTEDSVEILTSGCHSKQVADYLGQYVVYVRRTGADVAFGQSPKTAVLALQGPKAREALVSALQHQSDVQLTHLGGEVPLAAGVLEAMPYMSALALRGAEGEVAVLLCAGTSGEDGFEIIAPPGPLVLRLAEALVAQRPLVQPAGIYCLDMLRMEAGLPRVGADIPSGKITPIRAALSWTLDQSKMRSHLMFGWQKLFFQLAKGPKFRRVGLILDGPGHAGCRLLSNPHRQPIGEISSVAWSPALQCRVAQAYVRPEYAKANKHVLVTVPYNLPTHKMRRRAIRHWLRCGTLRSAYRRLVAACVVPLPFVPHRYPEPSRQRRASARLRTFTGDSEEAPGSTRFEGFPADQPQKEKVSPTRAGPRARSSEPEEAQPLPRSPASSDLSVL